jgi:tetratricopeptide (TPR) repeat protein
MKRRSSRMIAVLLVSSQLSGIATAGETSSPATAAPSSSSSTLHTQAITLYREKRYLEAVPLFRKLAEQTPDDVNVLLDLLWTLWYAGDHAETAKLATRLSRKLPDDAHVWGLLGRSLFALERREEAIPALEKSLQADPDQPFMRLDLSRAYMSARNYAMAIRILTDLRREQPEFREALPDLAKAQAWDNRFAPAAETWSKAMRAFPDRSEYRFAYVQALYFAGKHHRALAELRRHLTDHPDDAQALNFLVDTTLARGETNAAIALLERHTLEPTPATEARFLRLATLYEHEANFSACVSTLDRLLAVSPGNGQALVLHADCLRQQGQLEGARRELEKVLQLNPFSFRAYRSLADVMSSQNKRRDALALIRQARALDASDPALYFMEAEYRYDGVSRTSDEMLKRWVDENPERGLAVLLYHGITPHPDDPMLAYPIHQSLKTFEDHIRALQEAGYQTITPAQALAWLKREQSLPPRAILITFDDARLDSFRYADPILQRYGMRATMTLPRLNLDKNLPGSASWKQLAGYLANGRWDMQAHGNLGHTKIPVSALGNKALFMPNKRWLENEQRLETTGEWESRIVQDMAETDEAIGRHLGQKPIAFAYPEGDYGQDNVPNFAESADLLLRRASERYAILWHQDPIGISPRSRNPLFMGRLEVSSRWSGRDLIRHLQDKDPLIQAQKTLLRHAVWERRTHEAQMWLDRLEKSGASQVVLLTEGARIQIAAGDRARAWEMASHALELDPEDRETQRLVKTLELQKRWTWSPRIEYFSDNRDRENLSLRQNLDWRPGGGLTRWRLLQFYGRFREIGFPDIEDRGVGLGWMRAFGLNNELSLQAEAHALTAGLKDTYAAKGSLHTRWTDRLETDVYGGRAPYPTARALAAGINEIQSGVMGFWNVAQLWQWTAAAKSSFISDDNTRIGGSLQAIRRLGRRSVWSAVYRSSYDHMQQVRPLYYSPQNLQLHQLGLDLNVPVARWLRFSGRYLPGIGQERAIHARFIQVADLEAIVKCGTRFSLRPSFTATRTPTYRSYTSSLNLSLVF